MAESHNKGLVVGAMLVVGLLLGGGVGYAAGNMDDMKSSGKENSSKVATTDTKAASLRAMLNNLESEHVDLAAAATRAGFDGSPTFEASAASLDENSVALSEAIGSVYGAEAEEKFLEIWRSHITFFVNYTVAAKAGDQAGMDKAVSDLNGYVAAISDLLGGATGLPKEAVASLVT